MIRRNRPSKHFVPLENRLVRDYRLSPKAAGILHDLLSRPAHWRVRQEDVARDWGIGRDAVRSAFRELVTLGYAGHVHFKDERGQFYSDWVISDTPTEWPEGSADDDPEDDPDPDPEDDPDGGTEGGKSTPISVLPRGGKATANRKTVLRKTLKRGSEAKLRIKDQDQTVKDLGEDDAVVLGASPPSEQSGRIPAVLPGKVSRPVRRRPTADPAPPSLNTAIGLAIYFQDQVDAKIGKQALDSTNRGALAAAFSRWHRRDMTWVTIKKMIDTWVSRELGSELRLSAPPWRAFLAARYALQALVQKTAAPVMSAAEQADWDYALANQGPIRRVSA